MAYDIGPKLGIDGEAEFRKAINAVNTTIKTLGTEMAAVTSAYDKNDKSAAALTSRNEVLVKQVDAQKEKLERLKEGLAASAEKYGENDEKTQKWQQAVNRATAELNGLERELSGNEQALEELVRQQAQAEDATGQLTAKISEQESELGELQRQYSNAVLEYGKNSDEAQGLAKQIDELSGELEENRTRLKEASDSTGDLGESLDDAGAQADGLKDRLSALGSGLAAMGKAAAAALGALASAAGKAVNAVAGGITSAAEYGDNIDKMSQKLGMSAEAYQEWDFIMQHCGTSIDSMQSSIKTLVSAAETGNDAFERLGISQEQLSAMSQEELFSTTVAALQNVSDETERTYLASQLLGKGATELGPLLNTSAEAVEEMRQQVHELGGVMSNESVAAAATFQDSLQNLQTGLDGFSRGMLADFLPSVTEVMDGLTLLFSGDDTGFALISQGLDDFVSQISETSPKILEAGGRMLESLTKAIVDNLPRIAEAGTNVLLEFVTGLIAMLPDVVSAALSIVTTLSGGIAQSLPELIPAAVDAVLQIVDTLTDPDNLGNIIEAALQIIVSLAEGLINALPKLAERAPQIIANIVTTLAANLPKITESALQIIVTLAGGLISAIPELVKSIPQLVTSIVNGFVSYASSFSDIGKNIVEGVWQGIQGMAKWIKDKVNNFFSGIVDGVKGLLGIKSPSRVFAGIGGYMAEGLGQGWDDAYSAAEKDILNNVKDTASSAAEIGKSLGDVSYSPDVDDSMTAARSMADAIREEIESLIGNAPDMGRRFVDGLSNGIVQGTSVLLRQVQNMNAELRTGFGEDFSSIQQRLDRSIADLAGSSFSAAETGVLSASSHAGSSLSSGEMASIAAMFRDALQNASVYMDGRKVGRLITSQQLNSAMAKGV